MGQKLVELVRMVWGVIKGAISTVGNMLVEVARSIAGALADAVVSAVRALAA